MNLNEQEKAAVREAIEAERQELARRCALRAMERHRERKSRSAELHTVAKKVVPKRLRRRKSWCSTGKRGPRGGEVLLTQLDVPERAGVFFVFLVIPRRASHSDENYVPFRVLRNWGEGGTGGRKGVKHAWLVTWCMGEARWVQNHDMRNLEALEEPVLRRLTEWVGEHIGEAAALL